MPRVFERSGPSAFALFACARRGDEETGRPEAFAPNAVVRIGTDGLVTLVMPRVEMGQGIYTALALLIAEELEIDPRHVRLEHAPADETRYSNPLTGGQITGGSTSVRSTWEPMRRAGATARLLLVEARWWPTTWVRRARAWPRSRSAGTKAPTRTTRPRS
ncbi:hypothetical protein APR50_02000 [Variovorax paradoxus]|jgi:CO/xanthine dehydrogenase Mo-binding subunit|nr:hypothetical protein APR50_02000 [Variovorax paradoxus]KPV13849.1 hypothetical protein APR49_01650 [Variovorax paradoxus]KPV35735.1 hypothetical protein APR48_03080 [Variovorax paradoxus]KPV38599.1 hypothetical protein APR47_01625 [Variovorax paradoxus]